MRTGSGSSAARRFVVGAVAVGSLALTTSLGGGLVLAAQESGEEAGLVADLLDIEADLAAVAPLPAVETFPDRTWGVLTGDFVGASLALDEADSDLGLLIERAARLDTPVAEAVETVAASYRTMGTGYRYLAAYERAGLAAPPTGGEDGEGVDPEPAQAGDEARGQAEVGLDLLLEALAGHHDGYAVLRDVGGDGQQLFELRYDEVQDAASTEAADVRRALSLSATKILVGINRFEPGNSGVAPSQYVRYLCADRDDWYTATRSAGAVPDVPVPEGDIPDLPIPDCPALTNGNQTVVVPAQPAG